MIYNFPTVTAGLNLDSDTIATLAMHPSIVGIKLSCCDIGKLTRLTSSFSPSEFAVYPGNSAVFAPALLCGAAGLIGASVNLFPKVHSRIYALWKEGKPNEAMKLQTKAAHSDWAIGKLGGTGALKGLVSINFGYGQGRVRAPLMGVEASKLSNLEGTVLGEMIELEKGL